MKLEQIQQLARDIRQHSTCDYAPQVLAALESYAKVITPPPFDREALQDTIDVLRPNDEDGMGPDVQDLFSAIEVLEYVRDRSVPAAPTEARVLRGAE